MVLYRFLFAPVLLAVAVLTTTPPRRPVQPQPESAKSRPVSPGRGAVMVPHADGRARAIGSRPASVR